MTSLVERYRAFAVDLDGVVWRGEQFLSGAVEGLRMIRDAGKPLLFLTNNGAHTPELVVTRLASAGFEADLAEVLSALQVACDWIRSNGLAGTKALIIGPPVVVARLAAIVEPAQSGEEAGLVVVSRDPEFDFNKLSAATDAVRAGAELIAMNRDPTLPLEGGLSPGTGALVAAIETAAGRAATVMGKPQSPMMHAAVNRLGQEGVLLIGDRPDTDVAGARLVGWDAALVLAGSAQSAAAHAPDHVIGTLANLGDVQLPN